MVETTDTTMLGHFPLDEPRSTQIEACRLIEAALTEGVEDVVLSAPTGSGKTAIGVSASFWVSQFSIPDHSRGAYYLVTQKILQDQIEHDFERYRHPFNNECCSLKSAVEYPCPRHGDCGSGGLVAGGCKEKHKGLCPYAAKRGEFERKQTSVTNYAYFFTERLFSRKLPARNLIVADECHTVEGQIMNMMEVAVDDDTVYRNAPLLHPLPPIPNLEAFAEWLVRYIDEIKAHIETAAANVDSNPHNEHARRLLSNAQSLLTRTYAALSEIRNDPDNWIFWQEQNPAGGLRAFAKPLYVRRMAKPFLIEPSATRLYMSAYPGAKSVFCRGLGLDPKKVAWIELDSTFSPENRRVVLALRGSMGRSNYDQSLPHVLRAIEKIMDGHKGQKGLIHCVSYKLGTAINQYLLGTQHRGRLLFAANGQHRRSIYEQHLKSKQPTVLISPSMVEGISLDDDLARFQIIAKMPFLYLGDKQVAAKRECDPDWYALQTVMAIIQASGRIVRSEEDYGDTYILDSDFEMLWKRHEHFFPNWYKNGMKWL
jgi:Rad3-related DNA helicase